MKFRTVRLSSPHYSPPGDLKYAGLDCDSLESILAPKDLQIEFSLFRFFIVNIFSKEIRMCLIDNLFTQQSTN